MAEAPRETPEQRIARQFDTSLALARNGKWTEAYELFRQTAATRKVDQNLRDEYARLLQEESAFQLYPADKLDSLPAAKPGIGPGDGDRLADALSNSEFIILGLLKDGEEISLSKLLERGAEVAGIKQTRVAAILRTLEFNKLLHSSWKEMREDRRRRYKYLKISPMGLEVRKKRLATGGLRFVGGGSDSSE